MWIHVSAQYEKSFLFCGWGGEGKGTSWPTNQMVAKRKSQEKRRLKVEKRTKNVNKPAKWKQIPPNKPNSPPVAQTHHTQTKAVRESGLKRELPLCALHSGENACSKPTRISLANWGKTFSFATRLRDGTSWRRAVRADGRVCCRKRQLTIDRQLTTVWQLWQVATSNNRQRATCNCVN